MIEPKEAPLGILSAMISVWLLYAGSARAQPMSRERQKETIRLSSAKVEIGMDGWC